MCSALEKDLLFPTHLTLPTYQAGRTQKMQHSVALDWGSGIDNVE